MSVGFCLSQHFGCGCLQHSHSLTDSELTPGVGVSPKLRSLIVIFCRQPSFPPVQIKLLTFSDEPAITEKRLAGAVSARPSVPKQLETRDFCASNCRHPPTEWIGTQNEEYVSSVMSLHPQSKAVWMWDVEDTQKRKVKEAGCGGREASLKIEADVCIPTFRRAN